MNIISATRLATRSIIKVSGSDCYPFIQTLVTNDIRRLFQPTLSTKCIYAHIPNSMGRSLGDVLIYKTCSDPSDITIDRFLVLAPYHSDKFGTGGRQFDRLYLECSTSLAEGLKATLLTSRMKKNLMVEIMDNMNVWSLYAPEVSSTIQIEEFVSDDVIISKDPRLPELGYRFVSSLGINTISQLKDFLRLDLNDLDCEEASQNDYDERRYKLGVAEGPQEIIHGSSFPLECNIDYLHGLSFQKGLHTGDWLTARNWRKGVQKRFLPIEFDSCNNLQQVAPGSDLLNMKDGQIIGEVRCRKSRFALASVKTDLFRTGDDIRVIEPRSGVTGSIKIPSLLQRELLVKSTSKLFTDRVSNARLPFDTRREAERFRKRR